jgi:1-acyl-sn-glycerol-3-phosphate acyltransferase
MAQQRHAPPMWQPPRGSLWRRFKWALYQVARLLVRGLGFLFFDLRVRGQENVPRSGPVLLVSNHLHNFDMIVLGAAVPRPIFYMAKRELFKNPAFGWLIRTQGAFPVNRQAIDRAALRHVGLLLDEGMVVGVLPEGTRSLTRALTAGNQGVALFALQHNAPILPVAITGTQHLPLDAKATKGRWFRRGITVTIGKSFRLPPRRPGEKADLTAATDQIMLAIAALLPEEYRGVYGSKVSTSAPDPETP